eukprot:15430166-Alexandrium_andersonii.AAC.1
MRAACPTVSGSLGDSCLSSFMLARACGRDVISHQSVATCDHSLAEACGGGRSHRIVGVEGLAHTATYYWVSSLCLGVHATGHTPRQAYTHVPSTRHHTTPTTPRSSTCVGAHTELLLLHMRLQCEFWFLLAMLSPLLPSQPHSEM